MSKKQILLITLFTIGSIFLTISGVQANSGQLPGGTAVSVQIDTPAHNSIVRDTDITLTGSASISTLAVEADTTLIYVLDASGSTEESSGLTLNCPDQNPLDIDPGDPIPDENEIIDCEIAAAIALNEQAAALGTVDEVAMIMFAGDAVAADGTPDAAFQPLISPTADADQNGRYDVVDILQSIQVAFLFGHESGFAKFNSRRTPDIVKTDYADAIQTAGEIASQSTNSNILIVFVSDGVNNAGQHINRVLPLNIPGKQVELYTFAIPDAYGFGGTCTSNPDGLGSLNEMVTLQNQASPNRPGNCFQVSDPSDLPEMLPDLIVPSLTELTLQVNGGPPMPVTATLPAAAPATVSFETAVSDLSAGEHTICVTATGQDTSGHGSATDCTQVTVQLDTVDLALTVAQEPAMNGRTEQLSYRFMAANQGSSPASQPIVTHPIPQGLQITSASSNKGNCTIEETQVHCTLDDLLPAEQATISITAAPTCEANFTFMAELSGAEPDSNLANNTAVVTTPLFTLDYGDAPAPYASSLANDGARHCNASFEWLGLTVDGEADALANDLSDDGFVITPNVYVNQRMLATISTSGLGDARYGLEPDRRLYLTIWVDYNQDGDWEDEGEVGMACDLAPDTRIFCDGRYRGKWQPGRDVLSLPIRFRIRADVEGPTWVRARLSYGEPVGPTGATMYGEVEDFQAVLFIK